MRSFQETFDPKQYVDDIQNRLDEINLLQVCFFALYIQASAGIQCEKVLTFCGCRCSICVPAWTEEEQSNVQRLI